MTAIAMLDYGTLPAVQITAPDGAQAIVTLYGGHLISWKTADGRQRLFCSAKSALDGSRAIRGGVPVIFPQFAERGTGVRHGFARTSTWRLGQTGVEQQMAHARFTLDQADLPAALANAWPHDFTLTLKVALGGAELALCLDVHNSGIDPFAFSSALHTYFLADELGEVRIAGLHHREVHIQDKLDLVYPGVESEVVLRQPSGALTLAQSGFPDMVVWNPGAADAAALADLEDQEYQRFVCLEPALVEPLTLAPGASWRGEHRIVAAG